MLLKKIVIAEDDDAIAHMVNMALGDAGYLCLRAHNGAEALRLVRMHTPDLLVLDVMMPEVDGLEVARKLKADVMLSRTPILMLTALGDVDNKVAGFEAGADDYLAKPFDLREFSARVKALIRSSRRERDRNPTTLLPGSTAVEDHLLEVLAAGGSSAVLHIDLNGFDVFADQIGYADAEKLTATIGGMVLDHARAAGAGDHFVGHLGGADFVAIDSTNHSETLAKDILHAWDTNRSQWTDGAGAEVAMSIAIVPTEGLGADDLATVSERLAAAMRAAKDREESTHVVWKPEIA